jgi:hypothetical protein
VGEIDVATLKVAGLGEPQAGRCQEREERDVGHGAQPATRPKPAALPQQRGDLRVVVDVGLLAEWGAAEQSCRRDLGRGIERGTVSRKLSNRPETSLRTPRLARARRQSPPHGEIDRERAAVFGPLGVACEVPEVPTQLLNIKAQVAAQGEVVFDQDQPLWRRHGVTSGHGRATSLSAGTSSLA